MLRPKRITLPALRMARDTLGAIRPIRCPRYRASRRGSIIGDMRGIWTNAPVVTFSIKAAASEMQRGKLSRNMSLLAGRRGGAFRQDVCGKQQDSGKVTHKRRPAECGFRKCIFRRRKPTEAARAGWNDEEPSATVKIHTPTISKLQDPHKMDKRGRDSWFPNDAAFRWS